jgi:hypothetical protein
MRRQQLSELTRTTRVACCDVLMLAAFLYADARHDDASYGAHVPPGRRRGLPGGRGSMRWRLAAVLRILRNQVPNNVQRRPRMLRWQVYGAPPSGGARENNSIRQIACQPHAHNACATFVRCKYVGCGAVASCGTHAVPMCCLLPACSGAASSSTGRGTRDTRAFPTYVCVAHTCS